MIFTKRNSAPSGLSDVAWRECGIPGGKYHKSPAPYIEHVSSFSESRSMILAYHSPEEILAIGVDCCYLYRAIYYICPL